MSELSNQRLGFYIIVAAAMIVLVWGLRGLAGIINPILLAAVITITLLPVPNALERRGLKTGPSLLITILLVVILIVGFTWLVLASIGSMDAELPAYSASFQAQQQTTDPEASAAEQAAEAALLAAFGSLVGQMFLTLLIFVFMLYTALSLPNLTRLGINAESDVLSQAIGLTSNVRRYMVLTAFVNLLVGIGDGLLLWYFGVPYALLWGLIAWVLGFIPAVGFWIALIPPVLLAYALFGTQTALIIFIGYVLINGTAANVISPRVLGKGLSISPLIVFVSVFIWGWLLGGIGAILAIPLTMLLIAILGGFPHTQWLARLMSYVPGSEKEGDAEAMDRAKRFLSGIGQRLPSLRSGDNSQSQEPAPTDETEGDVRPV
jgi:predicted PurR-regulated permease PerM